MDDLTTKVLLHMYNQKSQTVTHPKSMCPTLWKAKIENVRLGGVKKALLMEKTPTKKMEDLILKPILRKYWVQASFVSREGEMGGIKRWLMIWRHLGASRHLKKIVLVDVSLMKRFLKIFYTNNAYTSLGETLSGKGLFCKTQAKSKISLISSMSICKTKQKL